jgi:CrcB protein
MSQATVALVAVGAAVGAPTRWYVDLWVQRRWAPIFPWGTFAVNVVGSALLGYLVARWSRDSAMVTLVGIGFCGGHRLDECRRYPVGVLRRRRARVVARHVT